MGTETTKHEQGLEAVYRELLAHGEFGSSDASSRKGARLAAPAVIDAYLKATGFVLCSPEPVAWTWETIIDPDRKIFNSGTVRNFATHWSTPPSNAVVTELHAPADLISTSKPNL